MADDTAPEPNVTVPEPGASVPAGLSGTRVSLVLLVSGCLFMEHLDGTIIATAAPRIADSFAVKSVDIGVAVTSYLLALALFIPISGWMADRYGSRVVFMAAIGVFTVASLGCALSQNLPELTLIRAAQGMGGAMMVPVGRTVALRGVKKSELVRLIAYLTWPALLGPVVAPALGGILTTYASWRWIFVVNLPLGVVAFALSTRLVPNLRADVRRPLDVPGFVLSGVSLVALVYAMEEIGTGLGDGPVIAGVLVVAAVFAVSAVWHLRRADHPLLDLSVFRIETFRVTASGGSLFAMGVSAVPFLVPLMFQDAFGWTPLKAGLLVLCVFAGNVMIKPFTTPLLRRFGFRPVLIVDGILVAVTIAACGLLTAGTPLAAMIALLYLSGVFRSVAFTAYNTIAFADVGAPHMADANTLFVTVQQLTIGLGVAVGALALQTARSLQSPFGLAGHATGAYLLAFGFVGLLALLAVIESLRLPAGAGSVVSGVAARPRTGRAGRSLG